MPSSSPQLWSDITAPGAAQPLPSPASNGRTEIVRARTQISIPDWLLPFPTRLQPAQPLAACHRAALLASPAACCRSGGGSGGLPRPVPSGAASSWLAHPEPPTTSAPAWAPRKSPSIHTTVACMACVRAAGLPDSRAHTLSDAHTLAHAPLILVPPLSREYKHTKQCSLLALPLLLPLLAPPSFELL